MMQPSDLQPVRKESVAWSPASLSNLGPGFDILGLAVDCLGDRITARISSSVSGLSISYSAVSRWQGPVDPDRNTAGVAAMSVLKKLGWRGGIHLEIEKGVVPGSGSGSSAASAVAAVWAVNGLFGEPFTRRELIEAALDGEEIASGARHGDNVFPAMFGGLVMVVPGISDMYRSIELRSDLYISVILPELKILTREARALLPRSVPLQHSVENAANLAFMLEAIRSDDWTLVGRFMMRDTIVEPLRAERVPFYESVKRSALDAGAFACCLSGSGPAMFSISSDRRQAETILQSMLEACREAGYAVSGLVTGIDSEGVRTIPCESTASGEEE